MPLSTVATAFAALFLQPAAAPAETVDYVILGDEARRARLEGLFESLPASPRRYRASTEYGMNYVGCVTTWRRDERQRDACIASRLPRASGTAVVVNTYNDPARGRVTLACHGRGGTGRAVLAARPARRDRAALEACMNRALAPADAAPRQKVGVRWSSYLKAGDREQARSDAARVWLVAVDHLGVPRGSTGHCLIQGRILEQERGSGVLPGAIVEAGIPCTADPLRARGDERRIPMRDLWQGMFARLYLDRNRELADFEAVERGPAGAR